MDMLLAGLLLGGCALPTKEQAEHAVDEILFGPSSAPNKKRLRVVDDLISSTTLAASSTSYSTSSTSSASDSSSSGPQAASIDSLSELRAQAVTELIDLTEMYFHALSSGDAAHGGVIELHALKRYLVASGKIPTAQQAQKGIKGLSKSGTINGNRHRRMSIRNNVTGPYGIKPDFFLLTESIFSEAGINMFERFDSALTIHHTPGGMERQTKKNEAQEFHVDAMDMAHAAGTSEIGKLCTCKLQPTLRDHNVTTRHDLQMSFFMAWGEDQALDIAVHRGIGTEMHYGRCLLPLHLPMLVPGNTWHRGTEYTGQDQTSWTTKAFGEGEASSKSKLAKMCKSSQAYVELSFDGKNIVRDYKTAPPIGSLYIPEDFRRTLPIRELRREEGMEGLFVLGNC